jgi:hypothetical protein
MTTQTSPWFARLAASGLALAALMAAGAAQARGDVYWSVGVNSPGVALGVASAPPVYVAPPPVYYAPPPPVYVAPRPVYYGPPPVYYAPRPVYRAAPPVVVVPGYGYGYGHRHGYWRGYR